MKTAVAFILMVLPVMLGCTHVGALERSLSSHYVESFGPCRGEAGVVLEKMIERINEELRRDGEEGMSAIIRFGDDDKLLERHIEISCGRMSARQLLGVFSDKLGSKLVFADEGLCFLCMPGCVPITSSDASGNDDVGPSGDGVAFLPVVVKLKSGNLCATIKSASDGKYKLVCAAYAGEGVCIESVFAKYHLGSLDIDGYLGRLADEEDDGVDFIEANGLHQEGGLFRPCFWERKEATGWKLKSCDVVEVDLCRFIFVVGLVECSVKVRYADGSLEDANLYILNP